LIKKYRRGCCNTKPFQKNRSKMKSKKILGFERNVFTAGLVSFFMDVSSEMIYPLVPLFLANTLGINKSVIGLIEGIAESAASLLKGFFGWASDKLGKRKPFMTIGYGISTLSRPIVALAFSWQHVLGARIVDRFGKGMRTAPRDAIIAESVDQAHSARAFGFHRAMDTMGAVVGPLLAFIFLSLFANNYRKVFWLSMVPGIIAVVLIILFITEKGRESKGLHRSRLTFKHFDWKFRYFIFITTLFALGNSSDAFLILRAQNLGMAVKTIPLVYLLFNLVYSISSYPAGVVADKFGKKRVMLSGFILFALVYSGFASCKTAGFIWPLFAFYGLFMGLTEGIQRGFLATIIPADFKATAFGIYNMAIGITMFPASLIGGWLWDNVSPSATFYFGAITAGLSSILFILFMFRCRNESEPKTAD